MLTFKGWLPEVGSGKWVLFLDDEELVRTESPETFLLLPDALVELECFCAEDEEDDADIEPVVEEEEW